MTWDKDSRHINFLKRSLHEIDEEICQLDKKTKELKTILYFVNILRSFIYWLVVFVLVCAGLVLFREYLE